VLEDNAGNILYKILPVGHNLAVLPYLLPLLLQLEGNGVLLAVPVKESPLHHHIFLTLGYEKFILMCAERAAEAQKVNKLKEIALSLAVLPDQIDIPGIGVQPAVHEVSEII
jgi:hypothetical protein